MSINLSIIIIAGNEEQMITDCLKSCLWADEIILVAANSTDKTIAIAHQICHQKLKVVKTFDEYNKNFSKWRNLGFNKSTSDWIFYVDADERVTKNLQDEIILLINQHPKQNSYYAIPRANYYLSKRVKYGGSYPDYVKRLFHRPFFKGFTGFLHEEPLVTGDIGYLSNHLLHFTHRNLTSMVKKTLDWTDMEAKKIYSIGHPKIVWWRILRMMGTKFIQRLFQQQMWRDKTVGWISVIFETFDTFIIYARLWELQQTNTKIKYAKL